MKQTSEWTELNEALRSMALGKDIDKTGMIRDENTGRFLRPAFPKIILSPCMFCGAQTTLEGNVAKTPWGGQSYMGGLWWVQCTECGAKGPELDKENAVSEWERIAAK